MKQLKKNKFDTGDYREGAKKNASIELLHKLPTNVSLKSVSRRIRVCVFLVAWNSPVKEEEECVTEDIFQNGYLDTRSLIPFKSGRKTDAFPRIQLKTCNSINIVFTRRSWRRKKNKRNIHSSNNNESKCLMQFSVISYLRNQGNSFLIQKHPTNSFKM